MIRSYTTMRKSSKDAAGILGGIGSGHGYGQMRKAHTFVETTNILADGDDLCDFAFDLHVVGNSEGGRADVIASFISTNSPDRIKSPSQLDNLDDDTKTSVVHVAHRGVSVRLRIHESKGSPKDPKMHTYYTANASGVFIVYSSDDIGTRMEAEEVWWPLYKGVCETGKPVFLIETIPGLLTGMMMPSATSFSSKKFTVKGKNKNKPEFRTAPAGKSALIREIFLDAIDRMIKATDPKAFDRLEMGAPIKAPSRAQTLATSRSMTPLTGPPPPPPSGPPPSLPPPSLPPPSTPVPPPPVIPPPNIAIPRAPSPRPPTSQNSLHSISSALDSPTEVGESDSDSDWEKDIIKGLRDVCNRKVDQGDYAGAEKSIERYLKRCQSFKDQETYKILLAEAQARQGKVTSAQKILLKMLNENLSTAFKIPDAGHLLADCFLANNDLDKAEEVIRYVMKARRKLLGKTDRATLESVALLVEVLQKRGDEEEAEVLETFVPSGFKRIKRALGRTTETMALDTFNLVASGQNGKPRRKGTYTESEAASPFEATSPSESMVGGLSPIITRTETEPAMDEGDTSFWKGKFYSLGGTISRPQSPMGRRPSNNRAQQPRASALYPDLHIACANGDLEMLTDLLTKKRLYINCRSYPSQQTPLHVLSECEDIGAALNVFEALRRSDQVLDINAVDAAGDTPLHLAFRWKRLSLARKLIANWAHLGAPNAQGNTPVHEAIYAGEEMMEMLLTLPPSVREVKKNNLVLANKQGKTPLYLAVEQNRPAALIALLLKGGAPVNLTQNDSIAWTPLHIAATMKRADCVRLLLDKGANPDVLGKGASKYYTPLSLAVKKGSEEIARMLIDNGAQAGAVSIESKQDGILRSAEPLHEALSAANSSMVRLLLKRQPERKWSADDLKPFITGPQDVSEKLWSVMEGYGVMRDDLDQPS